VELSAEPVDALSSQSELHRAVLQAADTELGRLLASIPPDVLARTTILLSSDNGTKDISIDSPYLTDRSKGTLYDGGLHVPLIVTGPLVADPGSRSAALVHLVDVFTTVADIAGVPLVDLEGGLAGFEVTPEDVREIDGVSLLPYLADPSTPSQRTYLFGEEFEPNGPPPYSLDDLTVRDATHKLLRQGGVDELYAYMPGAIDEGVNLLLDGVSPTEQEILDRLGAQLDAFATIESAGF
jgi:Sulfatase